ncbi:UNVERIFIED_CONTAM: ABC-type amino acid transport/signal transduction systems, periplasmic component/domain [Acetivibrio alkalicellulosi]
MNCKFMKFISLILCMSLIVVVLAGCVDEGAKEGFVIGVATGTTYADYAESFSKVSLVSTYDDDNATLMELANGRVDAIITDRLVGLNAINNARYNNMRLAGEYLYEETVAVAIRKEDGSLRQAINKALEEMINDGTYEEISTKYFGRNVLDGIEYRKTFPDEEPANDDSLQRVLEAGEIVFAMSGGYPPFNYFADGEDLTGFDVEIGKEVASRLGVKYVPFTTEWSGILEGLRSGRYDGIFGSMAITEERLQTVNFTDPYYYSGAQLFVLEDSEISGPEDLN